MKRKALLITMTGLFLLFVAFGFFGNHGGDVRNVSREVGASEKFTPGEIEEAMDIAWQYFKEEFEGCKLLSLSYDETHSDKFAADWAAQYGMDEAIVLLSSFTTDSFGGDGSFTPNETYRNWQWILTRNTGGEWVLQTWGYG